VWQKSAKGILGEVNFTEGINGSRKGLNERMNKLGCEREEGRQSMRLIREDNYRALAPEEESPVECTHHLTKSAEPPWYVIRMPGGVGGVAP